jgi:hypothetical protein
VSRVKVIYIAGWGRSGSNLLEHTLGQIDGWLACGEVNRIWHDVLCRCDAAPLDCVFWGPVLRKALDRNPELDPSWVRAVHDRWLDRNPYRFVTTARAESRTDREDSHSLRLYAALMADVYRLAAQAAEARVLVDCSKGALLAYLIAKLTDIDLYVLHLVRDPRGCAHSFGKRKLKRADPPRFLRQVGPAASSFNWLGRNAIIDAVIRRERGQRYLRVRYEDFTAAPVSTIRSICSSVGETLDSIPFLDDETVPAGPRPNHIIGGNPPAASGGAIRIRRDEQWRSRMGTRPRMLATLVAAPLMPRYGYRLRASLGG